MRGFAPESEKWPPQEAHRGKPVDILKHAWTSRELFNRKTFAMAFCSWENKFSVEQVTVFHGVMDYYNNSFMKVLARWLMVRNDSYEWPNTKSNHHSVLFYLNFFLRSPMPYSLNNYWQGYPCMSNNLHFALFWQIYSLFKNKDLNNQVFWEPVQLILWIQIWWQM